MARVRGETSGVHEMSARKFFHRRLRIGEKLFTHRTLGVHSSLGALVFAVLQTHARVTLHAVKKVDAETFASSAHVAKRTVVNIVTRTVEEVTHVAVITRHLRTALGALVAHRLTGVANVAHHL